MTRKKVFKPLFVVLATAFMLFPSCKTTEPEHVSGLEFTDPVSAGQQWVDYLLPEKQNKENRMPSSH